jgi:hypothetical protein
VNGSTNEEAIRRNGLRGAHRNSVLWKMDAVGSDSKGDIQSTVYGKQATTRSYSPAFNSQLVQPVSVQIFFAQLHGINSGLDGLGNCRYDAAIATAMPVGDEH